MVWGTGELLDLYQQQQDARTSVHLVHHRRGRMALGVELGMGNGSILGASWAIAFHQLFSVQEVSLAVGAGDE